MPRPFIAPAFASAFAPSGLRRMGLTLLEEARGGGAPKGADHLPPPPRGASAGRAVKRPARRLPVLHRGDFRRPRPRFRTEQTDTPHSGVPCPGGGLRRLLRLRRVQPFAPRSGGQPVVMPAGGCAGPPERGVTNPARGRRRPPHVQQCPAGTPLAWGGYA